MNEPHSFAPDAAAAASPRVRIQQADFDVAAELAELRAGDAGIGAVVAFVGTVRDREAPADPAAPAVHALELEHYPGMTEDAIERMIDAAHRALRPARGAASCTASAGSTSARRSCW